MINYWSVKVNYIFIASTQSRVTKEEQNKWSAVIDKMAMKVEDRYNVKY